MIKMGILEETTKRKCMFSKKLITPVQLVGCSNDEDERICSGEKTLVVLRWEQSLC